MDKYRRGFSAEQSSNDSYNFNGPKTKIGGAFSIQSDPEAKRKKRVAAYNVLAVEGRMKDSVRSGFKWLKSKYCEIRYGCQM